MLAETGAVIADPAAYVQLRNLLEGVAIAGGIPVPRFAVIDDPAPNSFGVGTRPTSTILGVTTGLSEQLTRDELEAVLAYEVSRIRSWDVALASWTVALTGSAITALDGSGDSDLFKGVIGWLPRRFAEWLQVWALRDQGVERDRAGVRFTRNPASLIRALEKLDADPSQISRVSRATAPLWIEFPASALGNSGSRETRRLAQELLLDERIDALTRAGPHGAGRRGRGVTYGCSSAGGSWRKRSNSSARSSGVGIWSSACRSKCASRRGM